MPSLRSVLKKLGNKKLIDKDDITEIFNNLENHDKAIRDKAIDEFAKEIRDWQIDIQDNEYDAGKFDFVFERIFEIAEELKVGAENE